MRSAGHHSFQLLALIFSPIREKFVMISRLLAFYLAKNQGGTEIVQEKPMITLDHIECRVCDGEFKTDFENTFGRRPCSDYN
jgi:hypothetical protein